jgi:hypothetical protein
MCLLVDDSEKLIFKDFDKFLFKLSNLRFNNLKLKTKSPKKIFKFLLKLETLLSEFKNDVFTLSNLTFS